MRLCDKMFRIRIDIRKVKNEIGLVRRALCALYPLLLNNICRITQPRSIEKCYEVAIYVEIDAENVASGAGYLCHDCHLTTA